MKLDLTIALCETYDNVPEAPCETAEVICFDNQAASGQMKNIIKSANGRYTVFLDCDFSFEDFYPFVSALQKANSDIIAFNGGLCFRTSVLKGLNLPENCAKFCTEILAVLDCKSCSTLKNQPFTLMGGQITCSESTKNQLLYALGEFRKRKGKLKSEVYNLLFDLICSRIMQLYISAMLTMRENKLPCDLLNDFDNSLKEDIVMYLAVEKRFESTGKKLSDLREKQFKISYFTEKKLRKFLKT